MENIFWLLRKFKKYENWVSFGTPLANIGDEQGEHWSPRFSPSSKFRLQTYQQVIDSAVYRVSIYDKSEQENLSEKELREMIKYIP